MTEAEWAASSDIQLMVDRVKECRRATDRVYRLFACACARRVWSLLTPEGQWAVEAVERFVDGLAGAEELYAAGLAARAGEGLKSYRRAAAWAASWATQRYSSDPWARYVAMNGA